MIYLIDDKKNRQEIDYGWNSKRLENYNEILKPIYSYEEMKEAHVRESIFSTGNIILFHESFFDNTVNTHDKDSVEIRAALVDYAEEKNSWTVFFSGSKSFRTLKGRVAYVPVSVLYENLKDFIEKVAENTIDLRYLMYGGKNPEIEEVLLRRLRDANQGFDETPLISNTKNLLALAGNRISIPIIFEGAKEKIFIPEEITDSYLNDKVIEWLSGDEVNNIFIPLCFGSSLSDYSGLEFACHIRCTDTINRLKPIFIYSFVHYSFLLDNEYFDVLKTKNIFLIDYTRAAFNDSLLNGFEPLIIEELSNEIVKLKLNPPKNYEDSHSIANEWAIYRWALAIQTSDDEIEEITQKINSQLYYKYLQTINTKSNAQLLNDSQLKIKFTGSPNILYIDDEADKGWFEIFCTILRDKNKLDFHLLDDEFNSKTQQEIIKTCIEKIKTDDIDLVILDFRLHPNDFSAKNIEEVTGLQLLKEIKKLNPGIQVIMFSATNKAWNLRLLQDADADGFIIKESPENSFDRTFTEKAIISFINTITTALKRRFLKQVFEKSQTIKKQLKEYDSEDGSDFEYFLNDLKKHINLIADSSNRINLRQSTTLDIVFLNCFNFLEKFKHYYLKELDGQFVLGSDEIEMNRYSNSRGLIEYHGTFIRINQNDNPSWFHVITALFIDYFSISEINDQEIDYLNRIKDKRNDYIHNKKDKFDEKELLMILSLCEKITSKMKE